MKIKATLFWIVNDKGSFIRFRFRKRCCRYKTITGLYYFGEQVCLMDAFNFRIADICATLKNINGVIDYSGTRYFKRYLFHVRNVPGSI
jgi:hypothetical protein